MQDETSTDENEQAESENQKNERASVENLRVLENIDVKLTVEVGNAEIKIRDLLRLNEGSIVELDRLAGDPLDIISITRSSVEVNSVFEFSTLAMFPP